ncbi:unnamed protein product, partial [Coregonus sp. 'balchen']
VLPSDPLQSLYDLWLSLVDHLNIKAFVNLTLADSVRHGAQHLLFISCLGSSLANPSSSKDPREHRQGPQFHFSSLRGDSEPKDFRPEEYVVVIADTTLVRNFCHFDWEGSGLKVTGAARGPSIRWPLNLLHLDSCGYVDTCSLFLLQLVCVLHESQAWRCTRLRLFLCTEHGRWSLRQEAKLLLMLTALRISAEGQMVAWDHVVTLHWQRRKNGGNEKGTGGEKE